MRILVTARATLLLCALLLAPGCLSAEDIGLGPKPAAASDLSGTVAATQGGTGLTSYVLGDLIYSSAANTLSKLTGNTTVTRKFLNQTGDGAASAAPAWGIAGLKVCLASSWSPVTAPTDTSTNTLATYTLKAGTLATNGTLEIFTRFECTNNANVKTVNVTLGSTNFLAANYGSSTTIDRIVTIGAVSSTSQSCWPAASLASYSNSGTSSTTGTENTGTDLAISFKITKATGADSVILRGYTIWVSNP